MALCTWKNCPRRLGTNSLKNKNGDEWANLCDEHHAEYSAAMNGIVDWHPGEKKLFPALLRAWALAGGLRNL